MDKQTLIIILREAFDTKNVERLPEIIAELEREGRSDVEGIFIVPDIYPDIHRLHDLMTHLTPTLVMKPDTVHDRMERLADSVRDIVEKFESKPTEFPNRGFDHRQANKAPVSVKRKR